MYCIEHSYVHDIEYIQQQLLDRVKLGRFTRVLSVQVQVLVLHSPQDCKWFVFLLKIISCKLGFVYRLKKSYFILHPVETTNIQLIPQVQP